MKRGITPALLLVSVAICLTNFSAQDHHHDQGEQPAEPPPRIFLDKSPRIVWYQLNRLTNQWLLMVERTTDDDKYAPVYAAILTRAGMARQDGCGAVGGDGGRPPRR